MIIGDYDKDYCMETSDIFLKYYLNNFKMKWDQASKLADYLGDYYSQDVLSCTAIQHKEVSDKISYVLNELFENALKFNDEKDITASTHINREDNLITLVTSNHIDEKKAEHFVAFLTQLFKGDPRTMFIEKIAQNLIDENNNSGLGYLTMILNFDVKLGFKFFTLNDQSGKVRIYTMARMPMLSTIEE